MKNLKTRKALIEELDRLTKEVALYNEANNAEEDKLPMFTIYGAVEDEHVVGKSVMSGTSNLFMNLASSDEASVEFAQIVATMKLMDVIGGEEDAE